MRVLSWFESINWSILSVKRFSIRAHLSGEPLESMGHVKNDLRSNRKPTRERLTTVALTTLNIFWQTRVAVGQAEAANVTCDSR